MDVVDVDEESTFSNLEVDWIIRNFDFTIHVVTLNTHNMLIGNVEIDFIIRKETRDSPVLSIVQEVSGKMNSRARVLGQGNH